jgi:hypothetical protein
MVRCLVATVAAAAVYGFSCGSVHSFGLAARNLVKFPLLILVTTAVSALGWCMFSAFLARGLDARAVMKLSLTTFRDVSVLLASLSPITLFLGLTIDKPLSTERLAEYPLFLGLNVAFIALCGTVALVRQARLLLRRHDLGLARSLMITHAWLAVCLVVGGQCAWYLRPYYGLAFMENLPFAEGTAPDFRGATSFFEAVYHLVAPPT